MITESSLDLAFKELIDFENYKQLIKDRICKIILGSSVIRVFASGSKTALMAALKTIPVENLEKYSKSERV